MAMLGFSLVELPKLDLNDPFLFNPPPGFAVAVEVDVFDLSSSDSGGVVVALFVVAGGLEELTPPPPPTPWLVLEDPIDLRLAFADENHPDVLFKRVVVAFELEVGGACRGVTVEVMIVNINLLLFLGFGFLGLFVRYVQWITSRCRELGSEKLMERRKRPRTFFGDQCSPIAIPQAPRSVGASSSFPFQSQSKSSTLRHFSVYSDWSPSEANEENPQRERERARSPSFLATNASQ